MHPHRRFHLVLHDNRELLPFVRDDILERVTLHEWPLSCVQRLTTSDGRKLIYKTQFGPTVEAEFYANASSSLLAGGRTIYKSEGHACLLIDFIEGPLIEDLHLPENKVVRIGRAVMEQIAGIGGTLPHIIDISTETSWTRFAAATLKDLCELIDRGRFNLVTKQVVRNLKWRALSTPTLSAIQMDPGPVHCGLGSRNLYVLPDGYRVIDWQRPILGPADLDLAILLSSLGFNPLRHVDESIVWVMHFLHIHWLTQCAVRWFPWGTRAYDKLVARLATLMERRRN